ncbi:hypothetical protein K439DRAFT_681060 [Ramaria rubella]|nr:hypothetical protein K439DRAFT_681060 [Ramaria rubella]
MYRHTSISASSSGSMPRRATVSSITQSQPNLPAHMRRMLVDVPPQSVGDLTPAQLIVAETRKADKHMSMRASSASPKIRSPASGTSSQEIAPSLQSPHISSPDVIHSHSSPLSDPRSYASKYTSAQTTQPLSPAASTYSKRTSYSPMASSTPSLIHQPIHRTSTESYPPLLHSPIQVHPLRPQHQKHYPPTIHTDHHPQHVPQIDSSVPSQAPRHQAQMPNVSSSPPYQAQSPPAQQSGPHSSTHSSGPTAMQILKGTHQAAKIGLKVYHTVHHVTDSSASTGASNGGNGGLGSIGGPSGTIFSDGGEPWSTFGINGTTGVGSDDLGVGDFGVNGSMADGDQDFRNALNGLATLNMGQLTADTSSSGNNAIAALLAQEQGVQVDQGAGGDNLMNALFMQQAGMQGGDANYINSAVSGYNPGY